MIYLTKEKYLYVRPVKLTRQEEKLLFMLASNEVLTYEEMKKKGLDRVSASALKSRLMDDTGLKVWTVKGVGFRLDDNIWFM